MSKLVQVAVGIIENNEQSILVTKRAKKSHQGGLWEFPGGKCENNESVYEALRRELKEELGIGVLSAYPLIKIEHDYGDRKVLLDVWRISKYSGSAIGLEQQPIRWVNKQKLIHLDMPAADVPIISAITLPSRYAITPDPKIVSGPDSDDNVFIENVSKLISKGIELIQFRAKSIEQDRYRFLAQKMISLCREANVKLVLNSSLDIVQSMAADGIHLTANYAKQLEMLNIEIPSATLLGISCHNKAEIEIAQKLQADYIVIAPVLATLTHPGSTPLGWSGFNTLADSCNIPAYALGGMTASDLDHAREQGGQGIAAIRQFWR